MIQIQHFVHPFTVFTKEIPPQKQAHKHHGGQNMSVSSCRCLPVLLSHTSSGSVCSVKHWGLTRHRLRLCPSPRLHPLPSQRRVKPPAKWKTLSGCRSVRSVSCWTPAPGRPQFLLFSPPFPDASLFSCKGLGPWWRLQTRSRRSPPLSRLQRQEMKNVHLITQILDLLYVWDFKKDRLFTSKKKIQY